MTEIGAKDYIFGSIEAYGNIWNQWSPIFTQKEKYPIWLRRNAISIWVCGLVDYLQKETNRLNALQLFTPEDKITNLIKLFDDTTKSILGEMNEDMQINIWFIRNRCLHGHLSLFYHDNLGISIYDKPSQSITKKSITRKDLAKSIDEVNKGSQPLTDILSKNKDFIHFATNIKDLIGEDARDKYHLIIFNKEILKKTNKGS